MSKSSISRKIAKAAELTHEIKLMTAQLDLLKADIRVEAVREGLSGDLSPVELSCKHGVCSVAYVEESLSIVKETDPRDLALMLPRIELWSELFTERVDVVLREGAIKVYRETLTVPERKLTNKFLELKGGTPRVTLPKMP